MQVDYIKSSAKQVKLFNREKKSVNKTVSYEKSDEDEIDGLKNLVEKATKNRIEEQKEEEQKLLNNLKSLSDQIKATKEEYESDFRLLSNFCSSSFCSSI